jgi:N-acylglucosamine-6-phosphate 2-epimerase
VGDYRLILKHERDVVASDYVTERLIAFNTSQCGLMQDEERTGRPLSVQLLDEHGAIVGGLFGSTQWDWLHIGVLWVAEELRGKGYGTRLVGDAEVEAKRRGCRHVRLGTFSFQARGFYEKLGYRVVGELEGYPPGHTDYLMRKDL